MARRQRHHPGVTTRAEWRLWAARVANGCGADWRRGALWQSSAPTGALLRAMRPSHGWLRTAARHAAASHARLALVALLCGAWWAAMESRVPPTAVAARHVAADAALAGGAGGDEASDESASSDSGTDDDDDDGGAAGIPGGAGGGSGGGGDGGGGAAAATPRPWGAASWQEPRCGACGARSSALPVHLVCGVVPGEPPCPAARATRRAFLGGAWRALGRAGCAREYERTGGIGTYETLALLVGGRRGLPRDLALELAANFAATWGAWSAAERHRRGPDTAAPAAAAPRRRR